MDKFDREIPYSCHRSGESSFELRNNSVEGQTVEVKPKSSTLLTLMEDIWMDEKVGRNPIKEKIFAKKVAKKSN